MPTEPVLQWGECLSIVTTLHALTWNVVRHKPARFALKTKRETRSILYTGSVVDQSRRPDGRTRLTRETEYGC